MFGKAAECERWQVQYAQKLCRLVSEFGRVCERRKLRVNVGKSKVMRCSSYGNEDRKHVRRNGEPLEEADRFKLLRNNLF